MARSSLFEWSRLLSPRTCYPRLVPRLSLTPKRYTVIPPTIYATSCKCCGIEYEYDAKRDGPYYCVGMYAEPLALYRSGGYHPVHLGDTMHGGRYKIMHKLGWGRDGTVWLARDTK